MGRADMFCSVSVLGSTNHFFRRNSRKTTPLGKVPTLCFLQEVGATLKHSKVDGDFILDRKCPISCGSKFVHGRCATSIMSIPLRTEYMADRHSPLCTSGSLCGSVPSQEAGGTKENFQHQSNDVFPPIPSRRDAGPPPGPSGSSAAYGGTFRPHVLWVASHDLKSDDTVPRHRVRPSKPCSVSSHCVLRRPSGLHPCPYLG